MHLQPTTIPAGQPAADDYVYLIGRPPLQEFLGFVVGRTVGGDRAELGTLVQEWGAAHDHVIQLETGERGAADSPTLADLPAALEPLREQFLAHPSAQGMKLLPLRVGMVNLDQLVVFQKQINLEYVARLRQALGAAPTDEDIFKMCFPIDRPPAPTREGRLGDTAFQFDSPSTDLRFLGVSVLEPNQVTGFPLRGGVVSKFVVAAVGFTANTLQALHVNNRLILSNASHRAYALREHGIQQAPCMIYEVTRREELQLVGHQDLLKNLELYLEHARPPMLKDYFDPKLRKILKVERRRRQVRVVLQQEMLDVPSD
jgi:hypothetical protein